MVAFLFAYASSLLSEFLFDVHFHFLAMKLHLAIANCHDFYTNLHRHIVVLPCNEHGVVGGCTFTKQDNLV